MPLRQFVGKDVLLRLTFLDQPVSAKITSLSNDGLWVEAPEMARAVKFVGSDFGKELSLFVTIQELEWVTGKTAK